MFDDHTSRYSRQETSIHRAEDGREIPYVTRRFLPDPETLPLLAEAAVGDGERLDQVAARTLGEPTQWWRIADASGAMDPPEITEEPGRKVRIPVPQL